jgi:FkbM family methyltransferase
MSNAEVGAPRFPEGQPAGVTDAPHRDDAIPLPESIGWGLSRPTPMSKWNRYYGTDGLTSEEQSRAADFARMSEPTPLRWSDGVSFTLSPGDQVSRALYLSGTYEPNTLFVLRALLREAEAFIDVGANAGVITLAAAQWLAPGAHIYAFEPSTREFARLGDTIHRNRLAQVVAVHAAVGAVTGRLTLRIADDVHGGLNTIGRNFPYTGIETVRFEDVEAVSIDDFMTAHPASPVGVMKIDVEGAEVAVLEGAARLLERDRPALIVEVFDRALAAAGSSLETLERTLAKQHYLFFAIGDDGGLQEIDSLRQQDGENVAAVPRERMAMTAALRVERR